MEKQDLYLLYFFRVAILVLAMWLVVVIFSPAINHKEQAFQQSLIQNQLTNNQLLNQSSTSMIDDLKEITNKRPVDNILPDTYFLVEKQCNLTLDTLNELFTNENISDLQLTEQVSATIKHLKQNIWTILEKFEREVKFITEEEINRFHSMLPKFDYSINNQNKTLIKSLLIGQLAETKTRFSGFVSGRITSCGIVFEQFSPFINTLPHKKNQESTMKVFFSPYGKTPHSDSLSINNVSIPMVRGVARYETIFSNEAMKSLIVKGEFKTPYEQSVILQDTFKIYPTLKEH